MRNFERQPAGKLATGKCNSREAAVLRFSKQVAIVEYRFSSDGGAVGSFLFGTKLPANAVITDVYSDEVAAVTSGGAATLQLKAGSTNLTDAEAYTAYVGVEKRALASSATAIKPSASANSELSLAIAGAAVTAGTVRFAVEFYISNPSPF